MRQTEAEDKPKPTLIKKNAIPTNGSKLTIAQRIAAVNKANAMKLAQSTNVSRDVDNTPNKWIRFFSVQYSRKSFKKYNEKHDGFLVVGDEYTILTDDESRKKARANSKKYKELEANGKTVIEFFNVDIYDELNIDEFTSGNCYLNLQANVNKIAKKKTKLNQKQEEEVDPFAPTNGVDLSTVEDKLDANDLVVYNNKEDHFAYLEAFLAQQLQPHQVHGVKFLYASINKINGNNINGAILADMMGLGKTI